MTEPTKPGDEYGDAAFERAWERRMRPQALDPNELGAVRALLKHEIDWAVLQEVIDQWNYDKRRSADEARTKTARLGRLPWISFAFTVISAAGGLIAGWFFQKPPGGH